MVGVFEYVKNGQNISKSSDCGVSVVSQLLCPTYEPNITLNAC